MNSDKITKLENSTKLKKKILSKGIWKSYSFIPPSLVLFVGILGLIYLFRMDYLLTNYSIPFVVIFAIGTIWFKSTKRYLVNKRIADSTVFLVCLCIPLKKSGKNTIFLFSTGKNRNNKYYLEKEKRDLLERYNDLELFNEKDKAVKIDGTDLYTMITQPPKASGSDEIYWIVYSGDENINFLSSKDIN